MKKSLFTFGIIVIFIFLFSFKGNTLSYETKKIKNTEKPSVQIKHKYLFLGDSIFWLYNTSEYFKGCDTVNPAVSGITAREILADLPSYIDPYDNVTDVIILIGTNDLFFHSSADETFMYIKGIIDVLTEKGLTVHVLSVLPTNDTNHEKVNKWMVSFRSNVNIKMINAQIKEYSKVEDFNFIDVYNDLLDENGNLNLNYSTDGLHLNEIGNYHMTRAILKYIDGPC
jgi:lysophospholipase L1-like esterase